MTQIIGIYSSRPRSGKSAFAGHLCYAVDGAVLVKFADTIRDMAALVAREFVPSGEDAVWDWFDGKRKEEIIPGLECSMRSLMRTLGTEWGRYCVHPDLWVNIVEEKIRRVKGRWCPLVIVDDVRFENEYDMLRKHEAILVNVERNVFDADEAGQYTFHTSDGRLNAFAWDFVVKNDRGLKELYNEADEFLRTLGM